MRERAPYLRDLGGPGCDVDRSDRQIGVQQPMEEMLSGLSTYGEASGVVRARPQSALHRGADRHVLVLDLLADGDAGEVPGAARASDTSVK